MHYNTFKNSLFAGMLILGVTAICAQGQIRNYRVSAANAMDPNEVTIAINPANPQNLIAGANLNYVYFSIDGGYTWTQQRLASLYGVWGDPSVVFDADGNGYFGHLANPPQSLGYFIDRIIVQKTTDGGETWNTGAGIGFRQPKQQDKEWVAADISNSPHRNNLYVAWTEFDSYGSSHPADSSRIRFSRSTDGGINWSTAITLSDRGGNCLDGDATTEGAVPAVGPEGQVYVAWSGPQGIVLDRSFDGGQTFGRDLPVAAHYGGWAQQVDGLQRANGMPVTGCDISQSPYRGTVYVLWSDQRNGDIDIFIARSTDQGETWSTPLRVNDDQSGRDQFFPWLAVDPVTGGVYVVFYDRRNTQGDWTEVTVALSHDGGQSFENRRVDEQAFDPETAYFLGDYINIAAYAGRVHPIWTRMDSNLRTVWTAVLEDTAATTAVSDRTTEPDTFWLYPAFPNPFSSQTHITYSIRETGNVTLRIYNSSGHHVATLLNQTVAAGRHTALFEGRDLPSGVYIIQLSTAQGTQTQKCILSR